MAKPWAEVAGSPEFQSLDEAGKQAAQQQYFSQVIAPQVPAEDLSIARNQFFGSVAKPVIDENAKSAPFSLKDLALSAGAGGAGGIKALTDLFGVTNAASTKLGEAQQAALAMKTPERQAEMARREAIKERAKGNTWEEIKAGLGGFAEAPLQETIEALTSSAPIIAASVLAPEATVPAGLARLGMAGKAIQAAKSPATGIGALMGIGGQKGQDYQTVKNEAIAKRIPEDEAERLAQQAAEYSLRNATRQGAAGATGALEGAIGVENVLGKLGKAAPKVEVSKGVKAPTWGEAVLKNVGEEAAPEFIQAATGQLGSNQALNQAGIPTDMMSGVLSSAIHDAVVGGALGAATSPAKMSELRKSYVQDQVAKEIETQAKIDAGVRAEEEKLAKTKETFAPTDLLGLPAPAKEAPAKEASTLKNPLGNLTPEELGPEVHDYIQKYRAENGMPELSTYSIEDVKDAMTNVHPEGERGALDSILTAKTGYTGAEEYKPGDVINAAVEKNVATDTQGFKDFLNRTTGNADISSMSQPQLFAAFKALNDMPANETGEQIVLPQGTNAQRFKPEQYTQAVDAVKNKFEEAGKPVPLQEAVKTIQEITGLKTDRDAQSLLDTAIHNDEFVQNKQPVFRTIKPDTGEVVGTHADKKLAETDAQKNGLNVQESEEVSIAPSAKAAPRVTLPEGYDIKQTAFEEGEKPAAYAITPEGRTKPLTTVMEENDIPAKIERLQGLRRQEADKTLQNIARHETTVNRGRTELESMEARGETETESYKKAKSRQAKAEDVLYRRIEQLLNRVEEYSAPLKAKPLGKKTVTREAHTVYKNGEKAGTFPSRQAAEESILSGLNDKTLEDVVAEKKPGAFHARAKVELERRRNKPTEGKKVSEVHENIAKGEPQTQEAIEKTADLRAMLDKFGLKDVGVKIVKAIEEGAEGSYAAKLIQIAIDAEKPIRTMRHEAMHALKELGFFTPQQWSSLEKMAKNQWIDQYLGQKRTRLEDGSVVSRLEAYKRLGLSESEIIEEAIADAFGDFDASQAPSGMLSALLNKLRNFFDALGNYLSGRGFESYKDVFGKIEKGELKGKPEAKAEGEAKLSLSGEGVPLSTRNLMEVQTTVAQQQLGLNTEIKRGRFNNVRDIATALNQYTLDHMGPMDRNDLSAHESTQIARAIADEVAYQLGTQAKTGTGLGWYSNNYPKAVKRLAARFPELGSSQHARSVFSALVAVTSNGEKVTKNIDNAVKLYAELRRGKPLVAMGNRRATALENNLVQIQTLLDAYGEDFEKVLLKEITVKDMNARLREMGEKSDGSYLANTVVPAAAVYFGPKLGAFYANLSGSEGYLTMDLWWTRSINRMRGLLIPKATEASINKFRDMMDMPSATRDEVVAATIPLRNKYEEYGWNTELEYLANAKEPAKKEQKQAWFNKAKDAAGDAYEHLLYEHNLEKMANTIYKNEYDMLEEAPFTATDRKFMYDAARKAQTMLRKENIDLTLADIQAALWYYEKRLYEKLSGRKADDIGYEEAIIAQSDQGNGRERPSVVFSERPNGGAKSTGKSEGANAVRGEPASKLSLREAPDTPEFKQWFGKSKILYADDKTPRVMYHGTGRDITEFRGKQANAIFLSPDPEFAEKFSKDSAAWMSAHPEEFLTKAELAKGVKDAIAAIRKDYRSLPEGKVMIDSLKAGTYADATAEAQEYLRNAYKPMMPSGPNILPVYVSAQDPFDYQKPAHIKRVLAELTNPADWADELQSGDWNTIESDEVQEAIQMAGFDAFYVQEGGQKNLAVYKPEQIKSVTGNVGAYDVNNPDIRYSLREFDKNDLPKDKKPYTLPENTLLFHGAHEERANEIEKSGRVLFSRPTIKTSGGSTDEGGLIFFGDRNVATQYANSEADPMSVQFARERGETRNPGVVFETATDRPYKLMNKRHILSKKEADALNKALGLPDYKLLEKGDSASLAAGRGLTNSRVIDRYKTSAGEMASPWPVIFRTLGYDGYYDDFAVALTADNGIRLVGDDGRLVKFSLRNIGDEIRSMPNGSNIYDSIRRTTTKRDEKGFIERMMDAISPESVSSLRQKALNRYNQLSVYDQELAKKMGGAALLADSSAESAALLSDLAAGVAAAALGVHNRKGGIPVLRQGYTTVDTSVKGPTEIFRPLAAMGDPEVYQAYQFWAGAKRGSRFLADGKEELFTPAMVNYAKQLEVKYPEFVQVQKEWIEYNDGLVNYMVDTGVLSKEKAAEFKRHGDYIPFYRQLDGEKTVGPNIFQSIAGVKAPKALKGSEAPLADFLETVVRNTQAAIQAGMKNTAAQRAVDVAVQIGEAKQLPVQSSAPDTVTVLRNGKPVSYQTADPLFIDAVKSLNLPELPFLGILSGPANLLRNLVTKDPGFMLANLMRDSMSAYVTSGANMLPVVDTIKNFGRAVQGADPAYQALLNAGLLGGYEFSQNIEASGEALAKDLRKKTGTQTGFEKAAKPFTSLWGALEKGTEASDAATRMAVYKDTLARTGNEAEALARALEVMNFNRKGSSAVVRVLTAAIPFLNARMQGLDVFYRAAFGKMGNQDAKAIQKSFFVRGATLASLSVMYWALTHDDDDYKKQEQETKDNNWLIPSLGIKIPIPFEVGILFKVIPERIAAYAFGNDTGKDFSKSMGRALTSTFGIAPPQVVLPYIEAKTNYSFYTGRPIVGQGMEGVAPEYQVGPGTSPIFQKIGKELGASPMMLEHMYKGYTGSMGMYLVDLMDAIGGVNSNSPKASKRFEQMPVIKRFALDPEARGTVTSYYELKNSVDEAVRTYNFLERTGKGEDLGEYTRENAKLLMTRDFISSMDKDLKELQDMTVAVRNSPMESDAKRDVLTTLTKASNAMTANIQSVRKAVE